MANQSFKIIRKPFFVRFFTKTLAIILGAAALAGLAFAIYLFNHPGFITVDEDSLLKLTTIHYAIGAILAAGLFGLVARGIWRYKNWARTFVLAALIIFIIYYFVVVIFAISSSIFAGEAVVPVASILKIVGVGLLWFLEFAIIPACL